MYGNATMHVILPFENVSSRHAEIEYSLDKCLVTDLNSTNGTTVNGQTVKRSQPLIDGDLLGFAGINIKLKLSLVDFQADCGAYVVQLHPL
jgi:pSer/pThr/pTyr-binding forkhead associated (FHA) protein